MRFVRRRSSRALRKLAENLKTLKPNSTRRNVVTKMRKTILQISLLLTLIIALHYNAFSQTSDSTTAGENETIVGKNETVSFLIEQNENARELIDKQEKRIADLESELAVEKENSASISKSYELAKSGIASLRQSNEALSRAVAINENTIAGLQEDNQKQREKVKAANKAKWKAVAVAASVIALKFIIP